MTTEERAKKGRLTRPPDRADGEPSRQVTTLHPAAAAIGFHSRSTARGRRWTTGPSAFEDVLGSVRSMPSDTGTHASRSARRSPREARLSQNRGRASVSILISFRGSTLRRTFFLRREILIEPAYSGGVRYVDPDQDASSPSTWQTEFVWRFCMTFKFQLGEIHVWSSSPACTRKLVEKGARLVNPAEAEDLRRLLEAAESVPRGQSDREATMASRLK